MQKEIVLEEDCVRAAAEEGWWQGKLVQTGVRGYPDRSFLKKGRWVLIEFKKIGEQPDGLQKKRHRDLRDHGAEVYVVDTHEEAWRILGLTSPIPGRR